MGQGPLTHEDFWRGEGGRGVSLRVLAGLRSCRVAVAVLFSLTRASTELEVPGGNVGRHGHKGMASATGRTSVSLTLREVIVVMG